MTKADEFYFKILYDLLEAKTPFLIGGSFALKKYTGIVRDTKDIDIFCKVSDYPKIIAQLGKLGYRSEVTDSRWLAKIIVGNYFADIIFGAVNGLTIIDDIWFKKSIETEIYKLKVRLIPPEELLWSKAYVQDRFRYDGSDINHLIYKKGATLDWKRLLQRMDQHWLLLFSLILNYLFVYPSAGNMVPLWLINELTDRLSKLIVLPQARDKVCMGPLLSRYQYETDINQWDFKTIT